MIRHEQAFDYFALHYVTFHNFRHIGFGSHPIPDAFRVDDNAGTIFAVIQTACLIGSNPSFQPYSLDFFLEKRVQMLRSLVGATSAGIILGSLVDAHEYVPLEATHRFNHPVS
jgi:hypothetical protein